MLRVSVTDTFRRAIGCSSSFDEPQSSPVGITNGIWLKSVLSFPQIPDVPATLLPSGKVDERQSNRGKERLRLELKAQVFYILVPAMTFLII